MFFVLLVLQLIAFVQSQHQFSARLFYGLANIPSVGTISVGGYNATGYTTFIPTNPVILSDSWIIYPNTMVASQGSSSTSFISDAYIGSASTIINNKNVALFCGGNTPIAGAACYYTSDGIQFSLASFPSTTCPFPNNGLTGPSLASSGATVYMSGGESAACNLPQAFQVFKSVNGGTSWTLVSTPTNTISPRYGHASIVLPSGDLIIAGGFPSVNNVNNQTLNDLYLSSDGGLTFSNVAQTSPFTSRSFFSLLLFNDTLYAIGGSNGLDTQNSIYSSPLSASQWSLACYSPPSVARGLNAVIDATPKAANPIVFVGFQDFTSPQTVVASSQVCNGDFITVYPSTSPSPPLNIGATVGGAIGGFVFIIALVLITIAAFRSRNKYKFDLENNQRNRNGESQQPIVVSIQQDDETAPFDPNNTNIVSSYKVYFKNYVTNEMVEEIVKHRDTVGMAKQKLLARCPHFGNFESIYLTLGPDKLSNELVFDDDDIFYDGMIIYVNYTSSTSSQVVSGGSSKSSKPHYLSLDSSSSNSVSYSDSGYEPNSSLSGQSVLRSVSKISTSNSNSKPYYLSSDYHSNPRSLIQSDSGNERRSSTSRSQPSISTGSSSGNVSSNSSSSDNIGLMIQALSDRNSISGCKRMEAKKQILLFMNSSNANSFTNLILSRLKEDGAFQIKSLSDDTKRQKWFPEIGDDSIFVAGASKSIQRNKFFTLIGDIVSDDHEDDVIRGLIKPINLLSNGNMEGVNAVVFKASIDNMIVVIKCMLPFNDVSGYDSHFAAQEYEFSIPSSLPPHPHIITILHQFTASSVLVYPWVSKELREYSFQLKKINGKGFVKRQTTYVVLDYYPSTLRKLKKKKKGKFNEKELMLIALQLFKGVSHMAYHKVSHRDLKDDNVFIQKDGTLVIADFGCALDCNLKLYLNKEDIANRMGAPATTAPEVFKFLNMGPKKTNPDSMWDIFEKNDVFSIGVLIYKLINITSLPSVSNEYTSEKIPQFPSAQFSSGFASFMSSLLDYNPLVRPTAKEAVRKLEILLFGPKENDCLNKGTIEMWLMNKRLDLFFNIPSEEEGIKDLMDDGNIISNVVYKKAMLDFFVNVNASDFI